MSRGRSPAWLLATGRRRSSYADLRVSDAERTEVADLLSRHYGDGRLDQAEFGQRLEQAMQARTYRDLSGLSADLPPTGAPGGTEITHGRRPRHQIHRGLLPALAIAVALIAGHALASAFAPWTWIALLCLVVLLLSRRLRRTP